MDRRKFIKTSMCLGCGAALAPAIQSPKISEYLARYSDDKFVYKSKKDLPNAIRIEACSLCQLNCPACWTRQQEKSFKENSDFGYLKFSNFKKLVDDNPQLKTIELSDFGEIFLNPELDKIIEYAHKKNIDLTAYTGVNLNDLSDEMAECLVVNQFKFMRVSIDGATPDVYKIYRVGGDLNKVFANIQKINKYKKMYDSMFPIMVYKFIIFGHNEHEIELAKQKAKELGMEVEFWQNLVKEYSPVKDKQLVCKQAGFCDDENMWTKKLKEDDYYYCNQIFESPQIHWNGDLLGCCAIRTETYGVNVFEVGLMNALNSQKFIDSKHMVTDLSYKPAGDNPCLKCGLYWNVLKKENLIIRKYA